MSLDGRQLRCSNKVVADPFSSDTQPSLEIISKIPEKYRLPFEQIVYKSACSEIETETEIPAEARRHAELIKEVNHALSKVRSDFQLPHEKKFVEKLKEAVEIAQSDAGQVGGGGGGGGAVVDSDEKPADGDHRNVAAEKKHERKLLGRKIKLFKGCFGN